MTPDAPPLTPLETEMVRAWIDSRMPRPDFVAKEGDLYLLRRLLATINALQREREDLNMRLSEGIRREVLLEADRDRLAAALQAKESCGHIF